MNEVAKLFENYLSLVQMKRAENVGEAPTQGDDKSFCRNCQQRCSKKAFPLQMLTVSHLENYANEKLVERWCRVVEDETVQALSVSGRLPAAPRGSKSKTTILTRLFSA